MRKKHVGLFLLIAMMLAVIAIVTWPHPASAQCGSSASSCKNCHETQKQDPVNTKGAWHTQHAFGDFCEFCHAGNVKAKDEASAHAGMLDPLSDVQGSCQSCHPNDYIDRAKSYADALGKTVAAGSTAQTVSWSPDSRHLLVVLTYWLTPQPGVGVTATAPIQIWQILVGADQPGRPALLFEPAPDPHSSDAHMPLQIDFGHWSPDSHNVLFCGMVYSRIDRICRTRPSHRWAWLNKMLPTSSRYNIQPGGT